MAWRGIHLSRPARMCVEHRCLKIEFQDDTGGTFRMPLEDLSYLVLDTPDTFLSSRLMSALAQHAVLVIGVNTSHLPAWISLPWAAHYKQGPVIHLQLTATLPLKKQLWARIIREKIHAQARTLAALARPQADELRALAPHVRSGDPDNTEARAARLYWPALFAQRDFTRFADDLPNALLNYGYALLRAAIARNLCAHGFLPQLGLHHSGAANAFNLADDLIEPFRPLLDYHTVQILGSAPSTDPFTTEHRRALVATLESKVLLGGEHHSLIASTQRTVLSLLTALQQGDPQHLQFPQLLPSP